MISRNINEVLQVRRALEASLETVPPSSAKRLAEARRIAIQRKKPEPADAVFLVPAQHAQRPGSRTASRWMVLAGAAAPVAAGIALFIGLTHAEHRERVLDAARVDAAVLMDELPVSAYVDRGFGAFVARPEE